MRPHHYLGAFAIAKDSTYALSETEDDGTPCGTVRSAAARLSLSPSCRYPVSPWTSSTWKAPAHRRHHRRHHRRLHRLLFHSLLCEHPCLDASRIASGSLLHLRRCESLKSFAAGHWRRRVRNLSLEMRVICRKELQTCCCQKHRLSCQCFGSWILLL